jgi:hypothetical protein
MAATGLLIDAAWNKVSSSTVVRSGVSATP